MLILKGLLLPIGTLLIGLFFFLDLSYQTFGYSPSNLLNYVFAIVLFILGGYFAYRASYRKNEKINTIPNVQVFSKIEHKEVGINNPIFLIYINILLFGAASFSIVIFFFQCFLRYYCEESYTPLFLGCIFLISGIIVLVKLIGIKRSLIILIPILLILLLLMTTQYLGYIN